MNQSELPFSELVAPTGSEEDNVARIPPPLYATEPGFRFDLLCLLNSNDVDISYAPGEEINMDQILRNSSLDEAQAQTLIDTLGRQLSVIQGPPGTGKSYTGVALLKTILAHREKADLGPILCVCYTNHALDQLLEQLVEHGVEQILRIGSRSKSEILESLNLRQASMKMDKTQLERSEYRQVSLDFETQEHNLDNVCESHLAFHEPSGVERSLKLSLPDRHRELFGEHQAEDGFQEEQHRRRDPLQAFLHGGNIRGPRRPLEVLHELPLSDLNREERQRLYSHWAAESTSNFKQRILRGLGEFVETQKSLQKIQRTIDLRCLQEANVIGVTTTGLARVVDMLRLLKSRVLVCEEAGEVFEAHALTSLLPSVEHAILIGDHSQLRPQIQSYELSSSNPQGRKYSLDVLMFERLVDPLQRARKLPYSTLEIQRRMRPAIANLIRSSYPSLKDASSVQSHPDVEGMARNVFWLDHDHFEDGKTGPEAHHITSHSNRWEMLMVSGTVNHLVKQGFMRHQTSLS